jgi:hypothetical protein
VDFFVINRNHWSLESLDQLLLGLLETVQLFVGEPQVIIVGRIEVGLSMGVVYHPHEPMKVLTLMASARSKCLSASSKLVSGGFE